MTASKKNTSESDVPLSPEDKLAHELLDSIEAGNDGSTLTGGSLETLMMDNPGLAAHRVTDSLNNRKEDIKQMVKLMRNTLNKASSTAHHLKTLLEEKKGYENQIKGIKWIVGILLSLLTLMGSIAGGLWKTENKGLKEKASLIACDAATQCKQRVALKKYAQNLETEIQDLRNKGKSLRKKLRKETKLLKNLAYSIGRLRRKTRRHHTRKRRPKNR